MYTGVVARNSEFSTQLEHHERILLYLLDTPDTTIYDVMRDCYLSESVIKASLKFEAAIRRPFIAPVVEGVIDSS